MEYYVMLKNMSYEVMKRHGGNLNGYYSMKEANLKRLHTYDSNNMTFWKRQNYGGSNKIRGFQWLLVRGRDA